MAVELSELQFYSKVLTADLNHSAVDEDMNRQAETEGQMANPSWAEGPPIGQDAGHRVVSG